MTFRAKCRRTSQVRWEELQAEVFSMSRMLTVIAVLVLCTFALAAMASTPASTPMGNTMAAVGPPIEASADTNLMIADNSPYAPGALPGNHEAGTGTEDTVAYIEDNGHYPDVPVSGEAILTNTEDLLTTSHVAAAIAVVARAGIVAASYAAYTGSGRDHTGRDAVGAQAGVVIVHLIVAEHGPPGELGAVAAMIEDTWAEEDIGKTVVGHLHC